MMVVMLPDWMMVAILHGTERSSKGVKKMPICQGDAKVTAICVAESSEVSVSAPQGMDSTRSPNKLASPVASEGNGTSFYPIAHLHVLGSPCVSCQPHRLWVKARWDDKGQSQCVTCIKQCRTLATIMMFKNSKWCLREALTFLFINYELAEFQTLLNLLLICTPQNVNVY